MAKDKSKSIAAKKSAKGKKSPRVIAITVISIVLAAVLLTGVGLFFYLYKFDFNGTILENVSVAGVDVGGMTRSEAKTAITDAIGDSYTSTPMVVTVSGITVTIDPEVSGADLNVDAAVWDAYKYGRRGFSGQKQADIRQASGEGINVDVSPYLGLRSFKVKQMLDAFSEHFSTSLTQSTYEVTGQAPELTLCVQLGIPEYGLDLGELYDTVVKAYGANQFQAEGSCAMLEPDPIDLDAILKQYAVAPVDAKYDTTTFDVIDGANGCGFDVEAVRTKLEKTPYGERVEIPFDIIEPETTAQMLTDKLYRDTLGNHTATQSSSSSRQTNLRLACEAINGTILLPGQTFSYNETLGERTEEKGYKYGASYSGGETVTTIGGGICQVSSTLYYCCLQADLEIITRENHSYAPGYVPLGMDATVSWGYLDFSFRNNMDYPIRIDASADGGSTTVSLMGTDERDYYIDMEYVVTAYYKYETTYETLPSNNPKGYKDGDYIVSPCSGYKVETYRCKYNKETKELISRDFEATSKFTKRDAVICKIDDGTPPTTPTTPATPTTPPEDAPGIGNGGVTEGDGELPEA